MNNIQSLMSQFNGFMANPLQFMIQRRLNVPQGIDPMANPSGAIQYLMNSGQMTQAQYNQLQQMAQQLQNNPQFIQMMGKR